MYEKRFPKALEILEDGLEDSLAFFAYPKLESPEDLFNEHAGKTEQRNPQKNQGCRHIPQYRILR